MMMTTHDYSELERSICTSFPDFVHYDHTVQASTWVLFDIGVWTGVFSF